MAHPTDDSSALNTDEARNSQQVVGKVLYYERAVDPTMLVTLNTIAAEQSKGTQETSKTVVQILNDAATHPEAITRYHTSGMTLHMHSDESFLSELVSKSRSGVYQYLSEPSTNPNTPPRKLPPLNGPIHREYTTAKNVLTSAMESELGALFDNCQIRGHPENFPRRNGPPTTSDTRSHRQHNQGRISERQYPTMKTKINWHEILLGTWQGKTRTLSSVLGKRKGQLGRLFYKKTSNKTSPFH